MKTERVKEDTDYEGVRVRFVVVLIVVASPLAKNNPLCSGEMKQAKIAIPNGVSRSCGDDAGERSANAVPRAPLVPRAARAKLYARTPSRRALRTPTREPSGNQGRKDETPEGA